VKQAFLALVDVNGNIQSASPVPMAAEKIDNAQNKPYPHLITTANAIDSEYSVHFVSLQAINRYFDIFSVFMC
jgi:hypothetical protein